MKYDKIHELKIKDRNTLKGMSKKNPKIFAFSLSK